MAKKKHSKPDPKVLEAQNRNRYIRQMKVVYDKVHPELFSSLTREQLNILYILRGTVIRTRSEQEIQGFILEYCDEFIKHQLKLAHIEIIPGKAELSFLEYSSYFFPLEVWGGEMKDQFAGKDWYMEILESREERIKTFELRMNAYAWLLMLHISNQQYTMYYADYKIFHDTNSLGMPRLNQQFKIKASNPREVYMKFDEKNRKTRNALEILYNGHKILGEEIFKPLEPFVILPSKLGKKVEGEEKEVPVFILRHALMRLEERLGCLITGYVESQIVPSLLKGEIHRSPEGGVLVAYYLGDNKAGYLYIDIYDDAVLIRTFLFLTNASTPEGERLREHIGLRKEDIKFLNIDRLTPLMESDILQDEELCDVFRNAGCESLIELCNELRESEYCIRTEERKQLAAKLKKYMQFGEEV